MASKISKEISAI
jgi:ATP-binding cassette, subfamily B (MDR/TAP), member 1